MRWTDKFKQLGIRTNADTPEDARRAKGATDISIRMGTVSFLDEERPCVYVEAALEGVRLYQEDVQSVLLAKAALNAGMEMLMNASGTAWKDIWKAYLCGGFGSRMNLVNAAGIGLIPAAFPAIAEEIGNAAIRGAAMLRDDNSKKRIREIASRAKPVLLGGDPAFNRLFTEHLHF